MSNNLKIGIVGVGNIARIHAQAINESENCRLVSVYSRNDESVSEFAVQYNITGYADWEEFISNSGLELDGGGVLINQAIHTIDLLQWFMGDVETVFGQMGTFSHKLEGEDNAVGTIRFKNGAIGVIQASTSVEPAQARRLEIHGEKGSIIIDGNDVQVFIEGKPEKDNDGDKNSSAAGASSPLAGFKIEPHKKQFEAIARAIINGEQPPVSGTESIKSLAIVLALYQSAKTNTVVNIDEFVNTH